MATVFTKEWAVRVDWRTSYTRKHNYYQFDTRDEAEKFISEFKPTKPMQNGKVEYATIEHFVMKDGYKMPEKVAGYSWFNSKFETDKLFKADYFQ